MAKQFQVDTGGTLTTGLLSHYKLEDGTDFYGSNNLTPAGNAAFVSGKVNNAVELDGTNDYLDGGDIFDFSRTSPFSFACWIEPDVTDSSRIIVSKKDFDSDGAGYVWYCIAGGKLRVIFDGPAGAQRILVQTTNAVLSDNTYAHVVLTYSGSSTGSGFKMYINGSSVALTISTDNLTSADTTNAISFNVGSANDGAPAADFDGEIDELSVFSKELTSTEVTDLYNGGSGQTMVNVQTQVLTETPTVADTIRKQPSRALSETPTIGNVLQKLVSRTLAEAHTLAETFTSLKIITVTMTLEGVAVADSIIRGTTKLLSETASLVQSYINQTGKLLTQTLTLADTLLRGLTYVRTLIESFTITDSIKKYLNGLLSRYSQKYEAPGTTYTTKYPARGTSYEQKYPS